VRTLLVDKLQQPHHKLVVKPSVEYVLTSLAIARALGTTSHIRILPPNNLAGLEDKEAIFIGFNVRDSISITNTKVVVEGKEYDVGLSSTASKALKIISSIRKPDRTTLILLSIAHAHFREEVCGLDCGEERLTSELDYVRTLLIPKVPNTSVQEWPKYSATPPVPLHDEVKLAAGTLQEILIRLGEHLYSKGFHTALLDRLISDVPSVVENPGLYLGLWEAAIFYGDFQVLEGRVDKLVEYVRTLNEEIRRSISRAFSEGKATVFKVSDVKLVDKIANVLRYYMKSRELLVVLYEDDISYARITTPYYAKRKPPGVNEILENVGGVEYADGNEVWVELCLSREHIGELISYLSKL